VAEPRRIAVPPDGFRSIAVLRLSSLGDVILTLPVVNALAAAWPAARLSYWVKEEYRDVVRFDPAIAHVRALERDARRIEDLVSMSAELEECDLIVDLHGQARTRLLTFRQRGVVLRAGSWRVARARWVHARWSRPAAVPRATERFAATLRPLGLEVKELPRVHAGDEAEAWAAAWMEAWSPARPPIALCPGARHATKRWPEEHWLALVERLKTQGYPLLVFSLAAERQSLAVLAAAIDANPAARWCTEPLPRMGALMSRCACAVTQDSGLMHLAAARGLSVVAMFGSTAPELGFAPAGDGHVIVCRHEPCQPCTLHGRASCPRVHFRCMRLVMPEDIAVAAARLAG
jgi:heptosyltransferase-2